MGGAPRKQSNLFLIEWIRKPQWQDCLGIGPWASSALEAGGACFGHDYFQPGSFSVWPVCWVRPRPPCHFLFFQSSPLLFFFFQGISSLFGPNLKQGEGTAGL